MITGTVHNSVKAKMLEVKWEQKKKEVGKKKEMTEGERVLANFQEQMDKERESNAHADTYTKLKTGGTLSPEEISYLESHDPEALAEYKRALAEKKAYENSLKHCKTREEVERVKMNRMGQFAGEAKRITNDPYIPLEKKVELMNRLNNRVCHINETHLKFERTAKFKDMPTEAELNEERTKEREEREEAVLENKDILIENEEINEAEGSGDFNGESAEDRKKKAERESGDVSDDFNMNAGGKEVSFEQISKSLQDFVVNQSLQKGGIDISL